MNRSKKLKVAILGSGNIGTDLLVKIMRSDYLECTYFVGRNEESHGIQRAKNLGVRTSTNSIDTLIEHADSYDLVFDATSATGHIIHAPILKALGKMVIDLTPSNIGEMCIPAVNIDSCIHLDNINLVTCGGQASIPLVYAIAQTQKDIQYIEVISSISSKSAGPATRHNLDEYIETTENAIRKFSGCDEVKTIINLNPAEPCIDMQTTIMAIVANPDIVKLQQFLDHTVAYIQKYVPGYQLIMTPTVENGRLIIMVKVKGRGDYLPQYAGNLDIINCAAIAIAEEYAQKKVERGAFI
ncbi:Acetaldehyde dehydrogenase (acetylating) [Paenibacillus nuruki]|uniref:Acetaldehyde dehydrogenase n=1 Tax=Paenibacillus nuruki TaxID=1886670 RepID=A0A1E3L729_9BACL|nr:acetaldehyde dehydrogenase (acetylating) [Paenibacillus nuruki]ODP29569.1 Acetaldehyde dehydrogenase (acetylating) [Paenibacillus nuruki]